MKLVSYSIAGSPTYGAVEGEYVLDLGRVLGPRYPTLRDAIASGMLQSPHAKEAPRHRLSAASLLPPIPNPDKVICIGLNYREHAAEAKLPVPEFPALFLRLTSTLVPQSGSLIVPKVSRDFDFEGELAFVIGKGGRHIKKERALSHILGYSCFNDASVRDYQFKHCLSVGKNFPATGAFGPWIVTADEIPDPSMLTLVTRLNGKEVQRGPLDDLIFDIPTIVEYVSIFTELVPGDVISTGTPAGVGLGRKPPLWMQPGDLVEVEISKIGILRNSVVAEK